MRRPLRTSLVVLVAGVVAWCVPGSATGAVGQGVGARGMPMVSPRTQAQAYTQSHSQATSPSPLATATLVTGDKVRLSTNSDGVTTAVPVPRTGVSPVPFSVRHHGDGIDVIPADAAALVQAGRIDRRLFDVAGLVAAGYDDIGRRQLPIVVTYAPGRAAEATAPKGVALVDHAATRTQAAGPRPFTRQSADTVSGRVTDPAAFWRWLTGPTEKVQGTHRTAAGALVSDVHAVSLDAPAAPPATVDAAAATVNLTLHLIDRNGKAITRLDQAFINQPVVLARDTEDVIDLHPVTGGLGAQVPTGHYSFGEIVVTTHGFKPTSYTLLALPDFDVTGNRTITLDARKAKQVRAAVQAPDARATTTTFGSVEMFGGRPWTTLVTLPGTQSFRTFALPTATVTDRAYDFAMLQSLTSSWGTYDVVVGARGRIPADTDYEVRNSDLATVESKFFAGGDGLAVSGVWFREAELPGDVQIGLTAFDTTAIPGRRVHLVSAKLDGAQLPWSTSLDVRQNANHTWYSDIRAPRTFAANQRTVLSWDAAAFRPSGEGQSEPLGSLRLAFAPFSPSVPDTSRLIFDDSGITGTSSLRRSSTLVAEADNPFGLLASGVPASTQPYSLDVVARHTASWSRYATSVHVHWAFTSADPSEVTPLRLLNLRATGAFDMRGRAPAGKTFRLDLPVSTVAGVGEVTATTLSVSYDDGKTWKAVPTVRDSALAWHAMVAHPNKPGGFVSLRAHVSTSSAHTLDITTIRAYGLVAAS